MRFVILAGLVAPAVSFACPGKTAAADGDATTTAAVAHADASACAKKAALVGSSCSYSTGMMASRVLETGKNFTFIGSLASSSNKLESQVAAPFTIGPKKINVIANEVVETVADPAERMTWSGKVLEVDGIEYFVVTGYEKSSA